MTDAEFVPLAGYQEYPAEEMARRADDFCAEMQLRRSVRHFADRTVPVGVIEECLRAAGTAPSGANMQPWHFVVVSDPEVKRHIREAAEARERAFYDERAPEDWLEALVPLDTDACKPFLQTASHLITVFSQRYGLAADGSKVKHYYVTQSVGIATGLLIAAVHHAGLVSLTYTPSQMDFLNNLLDRPANERPFLILAVGYPAPNVKVPLLLKKKLGEFATFV
jgi:nitroreductase